MKFYGEQNACWGLISSLFEGCIAGERTTSSARLNFSGGTRESGRSSGVNAYRFRSLSEIYARSPQRQLDGWYIKNCLIHHIQRIYRGWITFKYVNKTNPIDINYNVLSWAWKTSLNSYLAAVTLKLVFSILWSSTSWEFSLMENVQKETCITRQWFVIMGASML